MDKKPYWLAVLAYVVCTFLIAAPWHLVIFKPLYDELAIFSRREPIIPLGLLSMLIQGLILSYAYPLFAQGTHSAGTGARFGLLVGILFSSIAVIAEAAKHTVTSLPHLDRVGDGLLSAPVLVRRRGDGCDLRERSTSSWPTMSGSPSESEAC
ncbi:membrane protein of unknown function [Nitrospira moscoviensis]|uniref:Uncharacterized protein n=1 Tax=Nitrospira moscoviensis TaxID=42253 RepID=A0A0K2G7M8_NITMO|nr:membrane protein of unknown function [Nitrospira moscoviensis]